MPWLRCISWVKEGPVEPEKINCGSFAAQNGDKIMNFSRLISSHP
jgi:hypothetical protein